MPVPSHVRQRLETALADTSAASDLVASIESSDGGVAAEDVVLLLGDQTVSGAKTFTSTIVGSISGNAGTVTNGVYTTGDQSIGGIKTFTSTIVGSIDGNSGTVTNGVYTTGNQSIGGVKTFTSTIVGSIDGNSGTVTNGVYTTGNQTIGGTKTFSASPTAPFGSGLRNERFGTGAGRDAATGVDNIAIGSAAGDALTSGSENIFIGTNAGGASANAGACVAIGLGALSSATSFSTANVCLGTRSGLALTSGTYNTFIGQDSGSTSTTGHGNVAIGAVGGMSGGGYNIAIGNSAAVTAGDTNDAVILGRDTLADTDGVALGRDANAPANGVSFGPHLDKQTWHGVSTVADRERFDITVSWVDNTDATRKSRVVINAWDTVARECLRFEGSGTAAMIGAYGVAAVARPSAFTQTYATATKTHSNATSATLTDNSAGTADTTVQAMANVSGGNVSALITDINTNLLPAIRNNIADLTAQVNAIQVDLLNIKQVANSVIDDLQSEGWLQ